MPCIKVKCPLCTELVTDSCLGAHLLSKAHANHLLIKNDKLKDFLQGLKTNNYLTMGKNSPPLFVLSNSHSYHICLSCKKCYKNGDNNTGASKHYEKSPKCKEDGVAKLEAFLSPVVKVKSGNEALIEELKKKDKMLMAEESGKKYFQDKFDIADDKNTRIMSLLSKMCGPDFDIDDDDHLKKLEDFLDADSGNQGYYMKPFIQVQKEEPVDQ
jgi:hypothetical protein